MLALLIFLAVAVNPFSQHHLTRLSPWPGSSEFWADKNLFELGTSNDSSEIKYVAFWQLI